MNPPRQLATILVIDDDAAIRESLKMGLEEGITPMRVFTAHSADEGMELARQHVPDVAVVDLNMPLKSGFDFVDALRADPKLRTVKVLMLTANASRANEWESIDRDVDDFLGKPFDLEELEVHIRGLVEKPRGTSNRI